MTSPSVRWKQCVALLDSQLRLHYIDCPPPSNTYKGTILLIHGFPQTSYQFRHVIIPLADAGYRVLAPDYRGAGRSSKPASGFTKTVMAADLLKLIRIHLNIREPVHLVGHDIGGLIAYAYASRYSEHVASVAWGECPLPGTSAYEASKDSLWHFSFQSVPDLPEALVAGCERIYLQHFFDTESYNSTAISSQDLEHYTSMYSQPGAMRCAFGIYRAFERDAEENKVWVEEKGRCRVPTLALNGAMSPIAEMAERSVAEVHEDVQIMRVKESGHNVAEENPEDYVKNVLAFIEKHSSTQGTTP